MSDINQQDEQRNIQQLSLEDIRPNPYQPRKQFDAEKLKELAQSISQNGLLQPIIVTPSIQGYYIVAGERRYRACQQLELTTIKAIVQSFSDQEMREFAIIENLQREDLNPLEEAESYEQLMQHAHLTQQALATRLGKSRPYIANMLRLLKLPISIREMIRQGELSGGHGRTLLSLKRVEDMKKYADLAVRESWSVRHLEQQVNMVTRGKDSQSTISSTTASKAKKPKLIRQQEQKLSAQYDTAVHITTENKVGHVTFEFYSQEDYQRLIQLLNQNHL